MPVRLGRHDSTRDRASRLVPVRRTAGTTSIARSTPTRGVLTVRDRHASASTAGSRGTGRAPGRRDAAGRSSAAVRCPPVDPSCDRDRGPPDDAAGPVAGSSSPPRRTPSLARATCRSSTTGWSTGASTATTSSVRLGIGGPTRRTTAGVRSRSATSGDGPPSPGRTSILVTGSRSVPCYDLAHDPGPDTSSCGTRRGRSRPSATAGSASRDALSPYARVHKRLHARGRELGARRAPFYAEAFGIPDRAGRPDRASRGWTGSSTNGCEPRPGSRARRRSR